MKILVAGVGSVGQRHIRNLRTLLGSNVEIMAYRVRQRNQVITDTLDVDPSACVDDAYGLRAYEDLDRALARGPRAVLVCNPTSCHMEVALRAARAGCHVFVEKPLADRYDCVEGLIRLVDEKRLVAMVGYQMRFHPALQRARQLLERKAIGRVVAARVEVGESLPAAHPYEDYRGTYASRADLGGGVILSQSHELDYVYWLFGLPRRIFALGGHLSRLDMDVEDTASLLMECCVDGRPVPIQVSQDFVQRPPSRTCRIVGDEGQIRLDLLAHTLDLIDARGDTVERHAFDGLDRNQLFLNELSHFLTCLDGGGTPAVTLRDAAQSLRIALAARQSLASGEVVELP
jgi:predicted dehydrogenase